MNIIELIYCIVFSISSVLMVVIGIPTSLKIKPSHTEECITFISSLITCMCMIIGIVWIVFLYISYC